MKIDKKFLVFLALGAFIAISVEQLLWWNAILAKNTIHNDFWMIISEDMKSYQEGSKLMVLYSTDINQANLVLNIWKILLVISLLSLTVLIYRKR